MAVPTKPPTASRTADTSGSKPGSGQGSAQPVRSRRWTRFDAALALESVDKKALAELTWSGVPEGLSRCEVWQLLLGYRPLTRERRLEALQRKREEYCELRRSLYDASPAVLSSGEGSAPSDGERDGEGSLLRQIRKDLPRTRLRSGSLCPAELVVEHPSVQALMERVLFVWAVRQPASGYVQGLNDVLLPLIVVSLTDRSGCPVDRLDAELIRHLDEEQLAEVEADCYWCITKILSEIFDHYTHGQPGIQRMVQRLKDIIRRIDAPLAQHLELQGIDLLHTAFRWITCLMVRELPMSCCVRLWDTLIAESALAAGVKRGAIGSDCGSAGFEALLVYFCACFTAYFSARLQALDFEAMTFFLQQMPTDNFREAEVEVLLGEAYVLKSLFQEAPRHLSTDAEAPS
mmetsp:Transcript_99082/g.289056  ORF Transcript_99082/g.289056 Transcript_99082/m.289056 type:complete len:404 (-) Transcript_99082:82-1293(-)